jgi:FKBP-type peptidyl-prolyl cis-trans isomerase FklB
MMKPGDQWLIQVPFNLAYGSRGSPPKIPPFADLIFRVELLNVLR